MDRVRKIRILQKSNIKTDYIQMGFWRTIYYYVGMEYPEQKWDDRQKHLKYMCCQQIEKGYIRKLLPPMTLVRYKKKKNRNK